MRTVPLWLIVGAAALASSAPPAFAHPGRTDAKGCHTCRTNCAKWGLKTGEYHCHGSPPTTPSPRSQLPPPKSPSPPAGKSSPQVAERIQLEVVDIIDGDTFRARRGAKQYLIKLRDVEAPELEQSFGNQARDYLASKILGQSVFLRAVTRDEDLVFCRAETLDGTDLAENMLSEGLVWAMPSAPDSWRRLEASARARKAGLWRDSDPEPPWSYRRKTIDRPRP